MKSKLTSFCEAYDATLGNVSQACKKMKMSRETFYRWLKEYPAFRQSIEEIDESLIDFTETMLKKNIREGKEASIFFHLKTKGKARGYIETSHVHETNDDPWTEALNRTLQRKSDEQ